MIDDHAHPFPSSYEPLDLSGISLDVDPASTARWGKRGPSRLFAELLVGRLGRLLGIEPAGAGQAREEVAATDWPGWIRRLLDDAGVEGVVFDWGVEPSQGAASRDEYTAIAARPVWELVRVDPLVDRLIAEGAGAGEVCTAVRDEVAAAAARGAVGVKTILAYRTGLAVDPAVTLADAERSLSGAMPLRRQGKALRDLVFMTLLDLVAQLDLPLQVHTGFGDSEIRLREADPTLLEEALHTPAGGAARIVLIHGSFPWVDAAAYLATSRANVYAELSLSNLFAPLHTADRLARLLDLAPRERVMVGTDGHGAPETHWFAALVLADAWEAAARRFTEAGVGRAWVDDTREAVFAGNARSCYRLG